MNEILVAVLMAIFGVAITGSIILMILHGMMARHSAKIVEAITSMPTPAAQGGTVIKYVDTPPTEEEYTQASVTADTIVAEWAAEQERMGIKIDPQFIKDQTEMWRQFGEDVA